MLPGLEPGICCLSIKERKNGEELAERSQYIELTTFNKFPALYMDAMRF